MQNDIIMKFQNTEWKAALIIICGEKKKEQKLVTHTIRNQDGA